MEYNLEEQKINEIIEVLQFYANRENYYDSIEFGPNLISEIEDDRGKKAIALLTTIVDK